MSRGTMRPGTYDCKPCQAADSDPAFMLLNVIPPTVHRGRSMPVRWLLGRCAGPATRFSMLLVVLADPTLNAGQSVPTPKARLRVQTAEAADAWGAQNVGR